MRPIVGLSLIYLIFFFVSPYIPLKKSQKVIRAVYLSSLVAISTVFLVIQLIFQIKNVRGSLDLQKIIDQDVFRVIDFSKSRYELISINSI